MQLIVNDGQRLEKGELTPEKARQILHDKSVRGHPLTDQQRKFFGAVSSGSARKSDPSPGESLSETSTAELTQTLADIRRRLEDQPEEASLKTRAAAIAAELEHRGSTKKSGIDELLDFSKGGGPYMGPRGGKWADPEHTIPWGEHESAGPDWAQAANDVVGAIDKEPVPEDSAAKEYRMGFRAYMASIGRGLGTAHLENVGGSKKEGVAAARKVLADVGGMPAGPWQRQLIENAAKEAGQGGPGKKKPTAPAEPKPSQAKPEGAKQEQPIGEKKFVTSYSGSGQAFKVGDALKIGGQTFQVTKIGQFTHAGEVRHEVALKKPGGKNIYHAVLHSNGVWSSAVGGKGAAGAFAEGHRHEVVEGAPAGEKPAGEKKAKAVNLSDKHKAILRAAEQHGVSPGGSFGTFAQISKLVDAGLLDNPSGGQVYRPTEKGKKALESGTYAKSLEKALPDKLMIPGKRKEKVLTSGASHTPPKAYKEGGATGRKDYADPANYKYPIDTEKHVRAAISYFSQPKNASVYGQAEQKSIWARIRAAAKKFGIEMGESSGPPSVEKSERSADMSGIEELMNFAKGDPSSNLPSGEPKFGKGPEQGQGLAEEGKQSGSANSNSGSPVGSPAPVKAGVLSEDDEDPEKQMTEHKKPIEKLRCSLTTAQDQRDSVAHASAQLASRMRKGGADLTVGVGVAAPRAAQAPEPSPWVGQGEGGHVRFTNASDLACERLLKSEGDFYPQGAPTITPRSAVVNSMRACPICKQAMHKSLTSCPHCGAGHVVHAVLPGILLKSETAIEQPTLALLRPARVAPDLVLPNGLPRE